MTGALLYGYLGGWLVTSIAAVLMSWRLQDRIAPAEHPLLLSLLAGFAWPVLLLALAEAGAIALTTEVLHEEEPSLALVA